MPARLFSFATLGLSLLAMAYGCGESTPSPSASQPIGVGAVGLLNAGPNAPLLSGAVFEELARLGLEGLVAPPGHPPAAKLTVQGSIATGDEGRTELGLEARLRLKELPMALEVTIVAGGLATDADAAAGLASRAFAELRAALERHLELVAAPSDRLVRALAAAEPDEQILAARLLGQRRERTAIVALGSLLGDPRETVADTAASALVSIGDSAAVPVLISGIARGDLRSEVRAIEAMGQLGGDEARAYLEMTAEGHPHPEVKRLSRAALERMNRARPGR